MGLSNAERQRRYIARLKERAAQPLSIDQHIDAVVDLLKDESIGVIGKHMTALREKLYQATLGEKTAPDRSKHRSR